MAGPIPPREFLVRAFNRIRRDTWTIDLDQALADPIKAKILIAVARTIQATPPQIAAEKQAKQEPIHPPPRAYTPAPLDRKRLASGEREDD